MPLILLLLYTMRKGHGFLGHQKMCTRALFDVFGVFLVNTYFELHYFHSLAIHSKKSVKRLGLFSGNAGENCT